MRIWEAWMILMPRPHTQRFPFKLLNNLIVILVERKKKTPYVSSIEQRSRITDLATGSQSCAEYQNLVDSFSEISRLHPRMAESQSPEARGWESLLKQQKQLKQTEKTLPTITSAHSGLGTTDLIGDICWWAGRLALQDKNNQTKQPTLKCSAWQFRGVNTPPKAEFEPPTCPHWWQSWKQTHTIDSWKPVPVALCIKPLALEGSCTRQLVRWP